jgi:hypothetical protein
MGSLYLYHSVSRPVPYGCELGPWKAYRRTVNKKDVDSSKIFRDVSSGGTRIGTDGRQHCCGFALQRVSAEQTGYVSPLIASISMVSIVTTSLNPQFEMCQQ